ncbi:unnamed protein product [Orchesella dallaii]|uniref:Uncharacterized protein n=1 Tax=Orchesella dallaii TaxID=48710 RepID=A0ABP1QC35_9HEXA
MNSMGCFLAQTACPSPSNVVIPPGSGKFCPTPTTTTPKPSPSYSSSFYEICFFCLIGVSGLMVILLLGAFIKRKWNRRQGQSTPFEPMEQVALEALEEAVELRRITTTRGNRYEDLLVAVEDDDVDLFERGMVITDITSC